MLVNLCDTGPLVALIDKGDPHHARCVATLAALPDAPLLTTWPCFAEAMYLLSRGFGPAVQDRLWGYLADEIVALYVNGPESGTGCAS